MLPELKRVTASQRRGTVAVAVNKPKKPEALFVISPSQQKRGEGRGGAAVLPLLPILLCVPGRFALLAPSLRLLRPFPQSRSAKARSSSIVFSGGTGRVSFSSSSLSAFDAAIWAAVL